MKKIGTITIIFCTTIIAHVAISQTVNGNQAGFFMPKSERAPKYERLPPVPNVSSAMQPAASPYVPNLPAAPVVPQRAKHYIAVDGRYIPVVDDEPLEEADDEAVVTTDFDEEDNADAVEPTLLQNPTTPASPIASRKTDLPVNPVVPEAPATSETSAEATQIFMPQQPAQIPNTFASQPVKMPEPTASSQASSGQIPDYKRRFDEYRADLNTFKETGVMPYNAQLDETMSKLSKPREEIIFDGVVKLK